MQVPVLGTEKAVLRPRVMLWPSFDDFPMGRLGPVVVRYRLIEREDVRFGSARVNWRYRQSSSRRSGYPPHARFS